MPNPVREPAVAGLFYPAEAEELSHMIGAFLAEAARRDGTPPVVPKAIIAPHAGYVFSGPIAASAYNAVASAADRIRRVIILGPAHRVPLGGLAAPRADAFRTPLGSVRVDRKAIDGLVDLPFVTVSDEPHDGEHSLEVQLPFLQRLLGEFTIVPLVVGDADPNEVGLVIDRLWGGEETLIVVSSDLSHYLDYKTAVRIDTATARSIEGLRGDEVGHDQACGRNPINGLLQVAPKHRLSAKLVDLRNSGDTAGSRDRVVGYGAFLFA